MKFVLWQCGDWISIHLPTREYNPPLQFTHLEFFNAELPSHASKSIPILLRHCQSSWCAFSFYRLKQSLDWLTPNFPALYPFRPVALYFTLSQRTCTDSLAYATSTMAGAIISFTNPEIKIWKSFYSSRLQNLFPFIKIALNYPWIITDFIALFLWKDSIVVAICTQYPSAASACLKIPLSEAHLHCR